MNNMTRALLIAALSLAPLSLEAADGLVIVEKPPTGGAPQTPQIQIEKNRMRAEISGTVGEKQAIVFDATKQVMWILNYDKKIYSDVRHLQGDAGRTEDRRAMHGRAVGVRCDGG